MRPDELMARAAAQGIDLITTFEQSVPEGQERRLQNYHGPIPKQTRVMRHPEWTAQDAAHACFDMAWHLYAAFAFRYAGDQSQRMPLRTALLIRVGKIATVGRWSRIRNCGTCEGTGEVHEIVVDSKTGKAKGKPGAWETRVVPCHICHDFRLRRSVGVGRVDVVEQLVDLAIFEEWLTVHYVTGLMQLAREKMWPGLIGISQDEWDRYVLEQYRQVQCVIDEWCGAAYSLMQDQLDESETAA